MRMPTSSNFLPKYKIYIPSKGRYETMYTMRALEFLGVPYYIMVEPQEYELYEKELKTRNYKFYSLLELPFSNHGKGSGPARNFAWEHSKEFGDRRHWILDDNIQQFWRFAKNTRVKVNTGSIFRAWEDWNDRFLNMPMTGFQYKWFVMDQYHYKPFLLNTRLMSCILIENSLEHRWRGKWNEDVDLSLRTLKSGYCTALSYTFLCGKMRTGTVKGGNTTEIYGNYQGDLDYKKSKMLVDLHPDIVTLVKRYGRWHHQVDISGFQKNIPILDPTVTWDSKPNEYGMKLALGFDAETNTWDQLVHYNQVQGVIRGNYKII